MTVPRRYPDGWLRTGDLAYASADGHFFVVDRLKDMIMRRELIKSFTP